MPGRRFAQASPGRLIHAAFRLSWLRNWPPGGRWERRYVNAEGPAIRRNGLWNAVEPRVDCVRGRPTADAQVPGRSSTNAFAGCSAGLARGDEGVELCEASACSDVAAEGVIDPSKANTKRRARVRAARIRTLGRFVSATGVSMRRVALFRERNLTHPARRLRMMTRGPLPRADRSEVP